MWDRLTRFFTFWDARYEDVHRDSWGEILRRDVTASVVVALTAIPMAMAFAIAMGLRPEQGIVAGAVGCLVGRTFGGGKYQVYGPTAAFVPLVASLTAKYGEESGGTFEQAQGMLIASSLLAGFALAGVGLAGWGRIVRWAPNSIVIGFLIGVGVVVVAAEVGEALGIHSTAKGNVFAKLQVIAAHWRDVDLKALAVATCTFLAARLLVGSSPYLPAPLLAVGLAIAATTTVLAGSGLPTVQDKFGPLPPDFFRFTPPSLPEVSPAVLFDVVYFATAIVFISGMESFLCASTADRLAENEGTPFHPDKECWGVGLVQIAAPLANGFPCSGAMAATAAGVRAGAATPFAGYCEGFMKLKAAVLMAPWLWMAPTASIAGVLLWAATRMVDPAQVREAWNQGKFHAGLMVYTAVTVAATDFLVGAVSALLLYGALSPFFEPRTAPEAAPVDESAPSAAEEIAS